MPFGTHPLSSFPRAILHIDGDAFFASCEQSRDPKLRGKPVITGAERGIAASMSYEAKACGVTRAMRLSEIKRICPGAIILPSDYETYSILSQRLYDIVRRYTPEVEEYSIDECFADLTGMRRTLRMSYPSIAEKIKDDLARELGFTFSMGLAPNKVVAKIGSKWNKPNGLTVIPARDIPNFTGKLPVKKVWGIGPSTTAFLNKFGIRTALDFSMKDESWVNQYLSKPFQEIWRELNGEAVYALNLETKESYASIQKVKTFTPPSRDRDFVFSQLGKNIENACIKARRYKLAAEKIYFFLRTQDFHDRGMEIKFSRPTFFPHEIIKAVDENFNQIFRKNTLYRSTGITLINLVDSEIKQPDLFGVTAKIEKVTRVYEAIDDIRAKYGKHTTYLGASFFAQNFSQHQGERGKAAERKHNLFKGETARRRLEIPMFLGNVN